MKYRDSEKHRSGNAGHSAVRAEDVFGAVSGAVSRDETAIRLIEQRGLRFFGAGERIPGSVMQQLRLSRGGHAAERSGVGGARLSESATRDAAVVNLGCGLDDTGRRLRQRRVPDLQSRFSGRDRRAEPAASRRASGSENIACDLNDLSWFDAQLTLPAARCSSRRACSTIF